MRNHIGHNRKDFTVVKSQKPCVEHCSWGKKAEKERRNHHHQWEAINGPREKKWMTEQGTTSKYALHGVDEGKEGRGGEEREKVAVLRFPTCLCLNNRTILFPVILFVKTCG